LLGSINALDAKEEFGGLSSEDIDKKRRDREELGRVLQLEGISWRQKLKGSLAKRRGPQHKVFPLNNQFLQKIQPYVFGGS